MEICIEKLDGTDNATLALITDYITAYPDAPFEVAFKAAELKRKIFTSTTKVQHSPDSEQDVVGTVAAGAEEDREIAALKSSWEAVIASGPEIDALNNILPKTKAFQMKQLEPRVVAKRSGHRRRKTLTVMLDMLRPLLESLHNRSFVAEDGLWLAYLELLPCLLEGVSAEDATNGGAKDHVDHLCYEQLWNIFEVSTDANAMVTPYLRGIIEPLEKELVFHFHAGRQTAQRGEPQHFFTFLLEILRRVDSCGAIAAASSGGLHSRVDLIDFGQLRLCLTATAILAETYQWNPASASFLLDTPSTYVVHFINSFLDFVEQAKKGVSSQALQFLSTYVLAARGLEVYISNSNRLVEKALKQGTATLWRRPFLSPGIEALPFYLNTVHFVRCVEAITRRLCSTAFHVNDMHVGRGVRNFVETSIGTYAAFTQARVALWVEAGNEDNAGWERVLQAQEVALSLCSVMTAAEGWLEMLESTATKGPREPPASGSAGAPSEPLNELATHRSQLIRMSTVLSERLVRLMSGPSEEHQPSVGDYEDLESLLDYLHRVPNGSSLFALEAAIKAQFEKCLTIEERGSLRSYLSSSGFWRTSCLIG